MKRGKRTKKCCRGSGAPVVVKIKVVVVDNRQRFPDVLGQKSDTLSHFPLKRSAASGSFRVFG